MRTSTAAVFAIDGTADSDMLLLEAMMKTHPIMINFGIVGTGRVAILHAEAIARIPGARIVGAWNRTRENAEAFCKRVGCERADREEDLLGDDRIDAIVVTTRSECHYAHAMRALLANKHVVIEKPIAQTLAEIENLKREASERKLTCFPSFNYIYSEQMRSLRFHLDESRFGRLGSYWCLFNNEHPATIGEPDLLMRELMIHHVYSMLFLVGRPRSVFATASNVHFLDKPSPDQMMIVCQFDDGLIANLWGSFAADDRGREPWSVLFKVLGSAGTASIAWDSFKVKSEPEPLWDDMAYRDSFMHAQRFFVEECMREERAPLCGLREAADAFCILSAARQSILERRSIKVEY
jgi:myo-inositol 2-dehydrogenase / D-chiro-inositol 1-dehydrogenase